MKTYFHSVQTLALNTYKELIRDKLLYGILVVALLVTASSFFLATVSLGQNSRVLGNVGLASIHLFAVFICIFTTTNSLAKDVERRALYLLFSKPLTHAQYILGKFAGFILLLITTLAVLGGLFGIGAGIIDHSIIPNVLINLFYSFLEVSLLTSLSLLLASFASPLNASLYSFGFFIIGHSLNTLKEYVATLPNQFLHFIINVAYYLLPNLDKFDVRQPTLYGISIPASTVVWSLFYWGLYTSVLLYLAIQVTKTREV